MKVKHLKNNELRVIRIGEDAIRELILEHFMENGAQYFDLLDVTKVFFSGYFDMDERDLICAVYDENSDFKKDFLGEKKLDFSEISDIVGETTTSLYSGGKRYAVLEMTDEGFRKKS